MTTTLDMSLDDMIKSKRGNRDRNRERGRAASRGGGCGGRGSFIGGGRMSGAFRRGPPPVAINARPSAHTIAKSFCRTKRFLWQPDLFEESLRAAGISGIEIGTKLYVSNLHYGVTNEDIRELFSEIGELKRYAVHFDKNGRPSGSAEVVYTRRSDAFAALKRYNNVLLDGKPIKIEIVGANEGMPISARVNVTGVQGRKKRTVVMTPRPGHAGHFPLPVVNRGPGPSSHLVHLHKSFNLAIHSLLAPCSFQEFCEALPTFTAAEHERLHRLFTQVMGSLHENVQEEFQSICLETQVGTAMDTIEQLVEEQSLDPLFSNKTNVMDGAHDLLKTTKQEIQYLTEMLEKAEAQNHLKRDRIELLKKGRLDMVDTANAIEKLRSGISSYGMYHRNGVRSP